MFNKVFIAFLVVVAASMVVGQGVDAGGKVGFTFGGSAGIGGGAGLAPSLVATDEGTGHNLQGAGGGAKADAELGVSGDFGGVIGRN
ncbi:Hypothetical protein NTJ_15665 [Nesidiocoris tenuis]|nr:Hypothetical protein NTJ_15665 [Nesidiocoris tenuis]